MGVYEALDYIRTKRHIARPNPGFMTQLVKFENNISKFQQGADDSNFDNDTNHSMIKENQVTNSIKQLMLSFQLKTNETKTS